MKPVILIGAPRSGTNLLRDLLCELPGAGTWDCDEINPIWRHGNVLHPSDELVPEQATEKVRSFVRGAFEKLASRRNLGTIVEKTCANSLRVPFVREILPESVFIFLVRDGRDAAASAIGRWHAPLDLRYTLRKARAVPASDLAGYVVRFLAGRARKLVSPDGRLATWGPRFEGMDAILRERGVAAACALQWVRCVEKASHGLSDLGPERTTTVRYETFVTRPAEELLRLAAFLRADLDENRARELTRGVTTDPVGRFKSRLSESDRAVVEELVRPHLELLRDL